MTLIIKLMRKELTEVNLVVDANCSKKLDLELYLLLRKLANVPLLVHSRILFIRFFDDFLAHQF